MQLTILLMLMIANFMRSTRNPRQTPLALTRWNSDKFASMDFFLKFFI